MKTRTNQPVVGFEEDLKNELDKGTYDNAKPIYCHPVYLQFNREFDNGIFSLTMLIFNNSNDAFTKTTFIQWLKSLFSANQYAKVLTSGFFKTLPACCLKVSPSPNDACMLVAAKDGTTFDTFYIYFTDILAEDTIFEDGVNKIN